MKSKGLLVSTILFGLACSCGVAWASVPSAELPEEVRAGLSTSVREWIKGHTAESKNEYGKLTKRGYFSRYYQRIDDETFKATVHIEEAGAETKITRRHLLTLSRNGSGYDVAGDDLQDEYMGMHRETGARCSTFDRFEFEREGLHLVSGKGEVCADFFDGTVSGLRVHGESMSYEFAPPEHAKNLHLNRDFHSIYPKISKDHSRELEFPPAAFLFACDPHTCGELLEQYFPGFDTTPPSDSGAYTVTGTAPSWDRQLVERTQQERRDSPFAHYRRPYADGHRTWSIFVARELDPFTYPGAEEGLFDATGSLPGSGVLLTYDNWAGWEMEFAIWPRRLDVPEQIFGTLYGYYTKDTMNDSSEEELERREDGPARWHQVYSVKGSVDMGTEDPEMLAADIEFGIELKQPLRELPFFIQSIPQRGLTGKNLKRVLDVNAVQMDGKELTWTRTSQLGGLVILPEEMPAGTKLNLRMDFKTRAMIKYNHAFTAVSRFGWMPFVRFGDFIDEFELTVRTPSQYRTLGIGGKVSEKKEGDNVVTVWKSESPVVFPSVIFGRYYSDKPRFEAKKSDGRNIPVEVHVDVVSMQQLEIDVTSGQDAKDFVEAIGSGAFGIRPGQLRPIAEQAANSINLYSEISGVDYPYGELNIVADPVFALYGQAPSSLIYLSAMAFRGEGTMAGDTVLGGGGQRISKFLKSVTAHEVGHQWWGSRVSNANSRNYWFVESLAEFFSALYLEAVFGEKEYQEQVDEWRREILDNRSNSNVQASYSVWGGEDGFGSYRANLYAKGPYAFHMLREIYKGEGPPGPEGADKKFFQALKQFSQELAEEREVVTLDIQDAAQKSLGGVDPDGNRYNANLAWFFDQWIRGIGIPQYRMVYDVRQAEDGGWLIEGKIQQRVLVGSARNNEVLKDQYYRGVVDLMIHAGGEEYKTRRVVEGAETPFRVKVPDKPVNVVLNENGATLAHDVLVNKSWN